MRCRGGVASCVHLGMTFHVVGRWMVIRTFTCRDFGTMLWMSSATLSRMSQLHLPVMRLHQPSVQRPKP